MIDKAKIIFQVFAMVLSQHLLLKWALVNIFQRKKYSLAAIEIVGFYTILIATIKFIMVSNIQF